jgi:Tfp pilus assembly protein PilF
MFTAIMFLIFNSCNQSTTKDPCSLFKREYNKVAKGSDTSVLLATLNSIISKHIKCIDAYLTRGDIYINTNSLSAADKDFHAALKLDEENIYALYQLGIISYLKNDYSSSIFYLKSAMTKKENEGIIIDFKTDNQELSANKYDIESVEIAYQLGLAYYYNQEPENAFQSFTYCVENHYNLSDVYLYRGAVYLELKENSKACTDFSKSIDLGNKLAGEYQKKYCH